ncbi:MAG: hypothetical protein ACWGOX_13025, partial [Desulforhopalus sp.]
MKNKDELVAQAESLIAFGEKVLATESSESQLKPLVNEVKFHDFRISSLSFLSRVFGESNIYYETFRTEVTHPTSSRTKRGVGLLSGAKRELQGDWLATTVGALTREILEDMLRLAETQLEQGNLYTATSIAGTVLELQLRGLCKAKGISLMNIIQGKGVSKKPLQLAGEAYKKKIYTRQDNKSVISWLEMCQ